MDKHCRSLAPRLGITLSGDRGPVVPVVICLVLCSLSASFLASPSPLPVLPEAVSPQYTICPHIFVSGFVLGGGHGEDVPAAGPSSWTWARQGSSPPPLSSECAFCPLFPQWESFSRTQSWESNAVLRSSGHSVWLSLSLFPLLAWRTS